MYEVAASDIGTARVGLHSRDPAVPELSVPWSWLSPESLAQLSQMDQMFPLATFGVDAVPQPALPDTLKAGSVPTSDAISMPSQSGTACAEVPVEVQSSTASMYGVSEADYFEMLDQSLALYVSEDVSSALVFPFEPLSF